MGNKSYRFGGGIEKYFLDLCRLMEQRGHQIISFAMRDENNQPSPYSKYFAPNVQYGTGPLLERLKNMALFVYSPTAKQQISRLNRDTQPHNAPHHHIYHQLTPSGHDPHRCAGIPIVQGVHDYKLGCPRYTLFDTRTKEICDACKGRNYIHAVLRRCYDGSLVRSTMIAIESYYNSLFRTYQRNVDRFIVSNSHMKERLVRYGIESRRIVVVPNFIDIPKSPPLQEHDGYFLYFGRLSIEKGVEHLIRAMQNLRDQKLIIIGYGPDEPRLKDLVSTMHLTNVEFQGARWEDELRPLLNRAMCVVVPSYWHENSPMVIYQSFAAGKPVIASRRGGIPDLVDHKVNGLLFEAGNVDDLTQCMSEIAGSREKQMEYGLQGRSKAEKQYSPGTHYERIMKVYQELGVTE